LFSFQGRGLARSPRCHGKGLSVGSRGVQSWRARAQRNGACVRSWQCLGHSHNPYKRASLLSLSSLLSLCMYVCSLDISTYFITYSSLPPLPLLTHNTHTHTYTHTYTIIIRTTHPFSSLICFLAMSSLTGADECRPKTC